MQDLKKNKKKERLCLNPLEVKENPETGEIIVKGLVATTHPDKVGDILSKNAIKQIVDSINNTSATGDQLGAYRSVSLFHDWVKQADPTLDEAAFLKPNARFVSLDDGHYGVEVEAVLNKYYRGEMPIDEVKYRIDNGQIAGFSIEYDDDKSKTKEINYNGQTYRYIDGFETFAGVGLARARKIANPHAVIYKEIEEVVKMADEEKSNIPEGQDSTPAPDVSVEPQVPADSKEASNESQPEDKSSEAQSEDKDSDDAVLKSKELELKEIELSVKEQVMKELNVQNKVIKKTKEDDDKMENENKIPLSIKEMNDALKGKELDLLSFKEAASKYFAEANVDSRLETSGIPLKNTLKVKCENNKLRIVGGLQIKAILDSATNAGAYTETSVEFADVFMPGLVDTFNNQTNLFGAMRKVDNVLGGNFYGWKIKTARASGSEVDPDDPSVTFNPVNKLKLHTEVKERRLGVSVSDYTLYHARASMGDLFGIEVQSVMNDMMKEVNEDLFTEQVDTAGNKPLGLEAVADSAGNTSIYGKTRSTANRLAPGAAANTYVEVAGALTTAAIRNGITLVTNEGANRGNLRIVTNPAIADDLFELEDSQQQFMTNPDFGFSGNIRFDGIPVIVDSDCQSDALYIVDFESFYIVMDKAPQLTGLAKVGAAESSFLSMYYAVVYEQPRRIHMLNTLS